MDVCLFLNEPTVRGWQADALTQALDDPDIDITSILYNAFEQDRSLRDLVQRALEVREWAVVNTVNNWLRPSNDPADRVPVDRFLDRSTVTERVVKPELVDGWRQEIPVDVAEAVGEEADVAVRFGFNFIVGPILDVFEHGVLSYHHGDLREYRGQPAGFWEFVHGTDTAGVTVQQLTEDVDAGKIAALKRVPITHLDTWEAIRRWLYAESGDMLLPALQAVQEGRARAPTTLGELYTLPKGWPVIRFAAQNSIGRACHRRVHKVR